MSAALPFFLRDGDGYEPTEASRGYWSPQTINGGMVVGLLAHEIERLHGEPDLQPTRLTVDMFRLAERAPVQIVSRVIRAGGRLKLIEAELIAHGGPAARATCQFLRRSAEPPGAYWRPPTWVVPAPEGLSAPPVPAPGSMEFRPIVGRIGEIGPRQTWLRAPRPMVEGEPLTPFVRVATAADFASPLANSGDAGVGYINSDVTLYLHRLPATEWIGLELKNHQSSEGVAIGECWVYDVQGPIGTASVAGVAQRRRD